MKLKRNRDGFTMVELLVAIAILTILMGISFVAVPEYQRGLRRNEMDWTAKQIFVAAQNQLSKSKAGGYYDRFKTAPDGHQITAGSDTRYVIYNSSGPAAGPKAWGLMMPFGAIDETVRAGGSYIIGYSVKDGNVLEVFYSDNYEFSASDLSSDELNNARNDADARKRYNGNHIIGYYQGNSESLNYETVKELASFTVENADQLTVTANLQSGETNCKVILCIVGISSGAKATFSSTDTSRPLNHSFTPGITFVLDDVTSVDYHFKNVVSDSVGTFEPGEDIEIFATVQTSKDDTLSNVIETDHIRTNSLFGSSKTVSEQLSAELYSIRHLENLDASISGLGVTVHEAVQTEDLYWGSFIGNTRAGAGSTISICAWNNSVSSADDTYLPVNLTNPLVYEGNNRVIEGVTVNMTGNTATRNGGLFGTAGTLTVNNLELRNFSIHSRHDCGALLGSGTNVTVTNTIAYNKVESGTDSAYEIASVNASGAAAETAGGLVGSITGSGSLTNCAAAVYVKGTTAGGLIGTANSTAVSNSYTGGHTVNRSFLSVNPVTEHAPGRPNVMGLKAENDSGGIAGGLIGTAASCTVENCYSSCSVLGAAEAHPIAVPLNDSQWINADADANDSCYEARDEDHSNYGVGLVINHGQSFDPLLSMSDLMQAEDSAQMDGLLYKAADYTAPVRKYNYDPQWSEDSFPYLTIRDLNPTYDSAADADSVWFLDQHVGDWAYPRYNREVYNQKNN